MKILHVQNVQGIAGSENYLLALLPRLQAQNIEVGFALIYNRSRPGEIGEVQAFRKRMEDSGVPVHYLEIGNYLSPHAPLFLKRLCSTEGYAAVHTHLIYADCWGAMLKLLRPEVKIFSTKHGYQDELLGQYASSPERLPRNLYYRLFRFAEARIDASYACSAGLRSFLETGGLVSKGRLEVVEHGFDFPASPTEDSSLRFGPQQLTIVGRLLPRKGHRYALEAMYRLRHQFPQLQLVCCGEGPSRERLQSLAAELGLEERVHFVGFTTRAAEYQAAGDINLMPSLGEGLPLALMEAFNSSKPVVAFDVIGCRDLINSGETGLLVKRENSEQLAVAISRLLFSKARAVQLAEAAKARLENHYNLDRMIRDTINFYAGCMDFGGAEGSATTDRRVA